LVRSSSVCNFTPLRNFIHWTMSEHANFACVSELSCFFQNKLRKKDISRCDSRRNLLRALVISAPPAHTSILGGSTSFNFFRGISLNSIRAATCALISLKLAGLAGRAPGFIVSQCLHITIVLTY